MQGVQAGERSGRTHSPPGLPWTADCLPTSCGAKSSSLTLPIPPRPRPQTACPLPPACWTAAPPRRAPRAAAEAAAERSRARLLRLCIAAGHWEFAGGYPCSPSARFGCTPGPGKGCARGQRRIAGSPAGWALSWGPREARPSLPLAMAHPRGQAGQVGLAELHVGPRTCGKRTRELPLCAPRPLLEVASLPRRRAGVSDAKCAVSGRGSLGGAGVRTT